MKNQIETCTNVQIAHDGETECDVCNYLDIRVGHAVIPRDQCTQTGCTVHKQ